MATGYSNVSTEDLTKLLRDIAERLGNPSEPAVIYNTIVQICLDKYHAEASSLYLVDESADTQTDPQIVMVAGKGYSESIIGQAKYARNEGITGHVWDSGEAFKADSPKELKHSEWHAGKMDKKQWKGKRHCWSLIVVPLHIGRRVLGVLKVENKLPNETAFSNNDFQLLQTIANVVSLVVENARAAERAHAVILENLQKTVADLSGESFPLPATLYGQVVTTCREIFEAEAASLYLESETGGTLDMVAGDGYSKSLIGKAPYQRGEGITGNIWTLGKSVKIDTGEQLKGHKWHKGKYVDQQWKGEQSCWSLIGVPLKIRGRTIGVLKVEDKSPKPSSFSLADQRLLEMVANIVALSVQNERSMRHLQEAGLLAYHYAHNSRGDLAVLANYVISARRDMRDNLISLCEEKLSAMEKVIESMKKSAQGILSISRENRATAEIILLSDLNLQLKSRWSQLERQNIQVHSDLLEEGASVVADKAMLWTILDNLVQNSVESIMECQESYPDHQGNIGVYTATEDQGVVIYICDNGLGITSQEKKKLFQERFTTKRSGSGLGLAIVKQYVDANRGKIECIDALPKKITNKTETHLWQTIFRLSLPKGQSERLYTILVVDDQQSFYDLMRLEFTRYPVFGTIDWAPDKKSALEAIAEKHYDMILLDMHLGPTSGDGPNAYETIRQTGYQSNVIIVSGFQDELHRAKHLHGFAEIISKDNAVTIPQRCRQILESCVKQ